ncbi:MAG: response regulator [Pseudomonadota bacterium]
MNDNEHFSILLIEDDELDQEKMTRAVKRLGIDNPLLFANDGLEALELLRSENAAGQIGDRVVILLDLNMPRMNGHEFLVELRQDEHLKRIPVFVMSTSDRPTDINLAYDNQVTGYVTKPYSMQDTYHTIEALHRFWTCLRIPTFGY